MRRSNKKKLLKQTDGERNVHFPSCSPDVQAALRETRRTEWKTWRNFNAGVILTDEEARQLTEAGCEIYPMQWVDTDENACLRRDSDSVSVLAKCVRVDWLVVETSRQRKDLAQILPLVMWIRTISFAVGVHKLTSPSTHVISRTDTFKDKKLIESCCIVCQLQVSQKKESQAEKFWPRVFPTMVQQMQDEDCGFD